MIDKQPQISSLVGHAGWHWYNLWYFGHRALRSGRCRKNLPLADINQPTLTVPDSTLTPLTSHEIALLREAHPQLPDDYLAHMEQFGWGKLLNGCMLYSGPIHPDEVYGDSLSDSPILVLADDTCGYCFGYDPAARTFGELSPGGNWEPWPNSRGFGDYISSS